MEQKDALLRIGRNLANFQMLEHLLKELIPTLQVHGTVAEIQETLTSTKKEIRKASLGDLLGTFHSSVFDQPVDRKEPENLEEPVFSFTMGVDASPERIRATKGRWRKLVAQRNKLVHSQLMEYDLSRPEDCEQLCTILDAQNLEICTVLDELALLRAHRSLAAAALVEQLENGKLFEPESQSPNDA